MNKSNNYCWNLKFLILLAAGLSVSVGCNPQTTGRVTGTVKYKGQPIEEGTIVFEVSGARPSTGKIVKGSLAEVTTYEANDGASLGLAKIAVFASEKSSQPDAAVLTEHNLKSDPGAPSNPNNYMGMGAKSLIPARYNDPSSSGLTWKIVKGDNVVELDLQE